MGSTLSEVYEAEAAEQWLRRGIEVAERAEQLGNHRCYMIAHRGLTLWATGDWEQARPPCGGGAARGSARRHQTRVTGRRCPWLRRAGAGSPRRRRDLPRRIAHPGGAGRGSAADLVAPWGLAENALMAGRPRAAATFVERGRMESAAVGDLFLFSPFLVMPPRSARPPQRANGRALACGSIDRGSCRRQTRPSSPLWIMPTGWWRSQLDPLGVPWCSSRGQLEAGMCAAGSGEGSWVGSYLAACLLRARRAAEATELPGRRPHDRGCARQRTTRRPCCRAAANRAISARVPGSMGTAHGP